jgi:Flp pilus assembly protein TadB
VTGDTVARVSSAAAQSLVAILIAASAGSAVFFHAERHHIRHPSAWASFVFLFLIVGLPLYMRHVRRSRRRGGDGRS